MTELPPLPEPADFVGSTGQTYDLTSQDVYTAEQMREYAEAAVKAERAACAALCEAGVSADQDWDTSAWNQACQNRAAAIRARGET